MLTNRHKIRQRLLSRDGVNCSLCGEPMQPHEITIDHKIPSTKGGSGDDDNLQLVHRACNCSKGNRIVDGDFVKPNVAGKESIQFWAHETQHEKIKRYAKHRNISVSESLVRLIEMRLEKEEVLLNLPDEEEEIDMEAELTLLIERMEAKRERAREKKAKG